MGTLGLYKAYLATLEVYKGDISCMGGKCPPKRA